jgi:mono/diheme cytochrome c family protein
MTPACYARRVKDRRQRVIWAIAAAGCVSIVPALAARGGDDVADGLKVYQSECQSCHGVDGVGNPAMEKRLKVKIRDLGDPEVQKTTNEQWTKDIVDGVGKMNPMPDISQKDVALVIAYMRSLKKK